MNHLQYIFALIFLNVILISCQNKTEQLNLNILKETKDSLISTKSIYYLKYGTHTDSLHTRIVLKENEIREKWQPFKNKFVVDYMDVYFSEEKSIGFKAFFKKTSGNKEEEFTEISKIISKIKGSRKIKLMNDDDNILINEWEIGNEIIGLKYEKPNSSIAIMCIEKVELQSFSDKIFYSEFLDLTRFRIGKDQIKLYDLKLVPSKKDKDFYKEKFKELRDEYKK